MKKIFFLAMTAIILCACGKEEEKTGSISGIVTDITGEPVKASVRVIHAPENFNPDKDYSDKEWDEIQSKIVVIEKIATGNDGYFEFHNIPVGRYWITAETAYGYNYYPVAVVEGKNIRADIEIILDEDW